MFWLWLLNLLPREGCIVKLFGLNAISHDLALIAIFLSPDDDFWYFDNLYKPES